MITKQCSKCKETKPLEDFAKHRGCQYGVRPDCRKCVADRMKDYQERNRDVIRHKRSTQEYRNTQKNSSLLRKFGIDRETYESMLKAQDKKCKICRTDTCDRYGNVFCVDHCHETGRVRGLLCNKCNLMLGNAKDNPEILLAGISYLQD